MKPINSLVALTGIIQASPTFFEELGSGSDAVSYQTMGTYMEKNFDWPNFYQEVQNGIAAGYNTMYLGFYMSLHGCQGACTAWRDLPSSTKQQVLDYAAANNAQIGLSIGGPGEFIEGVMREGQDNIVNFAQQAAQFAWSQGFQHIDIATELSGSLTQPSIWATNGSYSNFISTVVKEVKKVGYTVDQISLTSPASYFSPNFVRCTQSQIDSDTCSNSLNYFALNSRTSSSDAVGHINMDMLNEDSNYQTYSYIFVNDDTFEDPYGYGNWGIGSAVQQVMNAGSGVDGSKIAIVKSQSESESSVKSGYVDSLSLHNWGCQANNDFGWSGGFVGWTWSSYDGYDTINWPGVLMGVCDCLDNDTCR